MSAAVATPKPGTIRYRLRSTGSSSDRLGPCEVCGKPCSDVFRQVPEVFYSFDYPGGTHSGWSQKPCLFGHKECLEGRQQK